MCDETKTGSFIKTTKQRLEFSTPETIEAVVCKKGVFKNFAKFTGKHLCEGLFFNKIEGLRP